MPFTATLVIGLGILEAKIFGVEVSEIISRALLLVETISMPVQEAEVILATAMYLGISDLTLGIIVALIFGGFVFIMKYGKQCCKSIIWIIDTCKMNLNKGARRPRHKDLIGRMFVTLPRYEPTTTVA